MTVRQEQRNTLEEKKSGLKPSFVPSDSSQDPKPGENDIHGKRILVVDDDANMRKLTAHVFAKAGGEVYTATNGREGLQQFFAHRPALVILDIMMPGMDGWETCRHIRQMCDVPIIMLTSLTGEDECVQGLDLGAVDYITKPFSPKILLARSRAALRQAELASRAEEPTTYSDDYLTIDLERRRVLVQGEPVKLTKTEWRLLAYLFRNSGWVLTFRQILENVWGWEYLDSVEYVHTFISNLRRKLEQDPKQPSYLLTEHGVGYRFER